MSRVAFLKKFQNLNFCKIFKLSSFDGKVRDSGLGESCAESQELVNLEPPNLYKRCKAPWLTLMLNWGFIDLDLQGQI